MIIIKMIQKEATKTTTHHYHQWPRHGDHKMIIGRWWKRKEKGSLSMGESDSDGEQQRVWISCGFKVLLPIVLLP